MHAGGDCEYVPVHQLNDEYTALRHAWRGSGIFDGKFNLDGIPPPMP